MRAWVARVDAACSRFRDDSDLSRVNAQPGVPVTVSAELVSAVTAALAMADATDGLYDPTVGQAVIAAGYDRTFEAVAGSGPGPLLEGRPGGGWRDVVVNAPASTVTVPRGFRLDLGGSAKGWTVDAAIQGIAEAGVAGGAGVCVSAGGDLAVSGTAPDGGWPVTIRERVEGPAESGERSVRLGRGAMATSGVTYRRWEQGEQEAHHIIDPRTGRPGASRWATVTVFGDSCLVVDTSATAAWLLDGDAVDWLEAAGLGGRLVDTNGGEVLAGDLGRWLLAGF